MHANHAAAKLRRTVRRIARRYTCEALEGRVLLSADLIGAGFSATPVYQPIAPTVSVSYSIKNQGTSGSINGFATGFYLSSDSTITTADTFLGSASYPKTISAGDTLSSSISLSLPATDPFRTDNSYFVGMIIDTGNSIAESNESNNSNAESFLGRPIDRDNIASEASLPALADGVNVIAMPLTVGGAELTEKLGEEWIGAYDFDVYSFNGIAGHNFSVAGTNYPADVPYYRLYNASWTLVASQVNPQTAGLTYTTPDAGTYYAVVSGAGSTTGDPRQVSGRTAASPASTSYGISVYDGSADLRAAINKFFYTGTNFSSASAVITIENDSYYTNAGPFKVDYYLSDDNVLSTGSDLYVGMASFLGVRSYDSSIPGYVQETVTTALSTPSIDPFRTDNHYYLFAYIDFLNVISETDETNNLVSIPIGPGSENDLPSPADGQNVLGTQLSDSPAYTANGDIGLSEWIGPYDQDIYNFALLSGEKISLDLDLSSGKLDSYFRLFDASWNLVASNDNSAAPGETLDSDSYLEFTNLLLGGTFHLVVSSASNKTSNPRVLTGRSAGTTGAYSLTAIRFPTGPISGTVFDDHNGNGMRDAGEEGIAGRTIYIDQNSNGQYLNGDPAVTTDANGNYAFTGRLPGTYDIRENLPTGWLQTVPASGDQIVTATSNQSVSGRDFADWQSPILSGTAFNDANADGARQAGETGVSGIPIYVDLNNNGIRDTTTMVFTATGLDLPISIAGPWRISDVDVSFNIQYPYNQDIQIQITKRATNATSLLINSIGSIKTIPNTASLTLDDEATLPSPIGFSPDPGIFRPRTPLAAFDGLDPNGDWQLHVNDSDALFVGSVTAFSINLTLIEPGATTDANGKYNFGYLPPGAYTLREEQQEDDRVQTAPASHAIVVNADEGQTYTGLDFGNFSTHIAGAGGDDTFRVRLDSTGNFDDIFQNAPTTGAPTFHLPRSDFTKLFFDGGAGNDTLIVDGSRGNPIPINGIDYTGGADDGAPGDSLELIGDGAITGSYTPSAITPGSGTALLGNLPLHFSGLEPINASAFSAFSLITPNSSDTITIDSLAPGANRISGVSGGIAFESLAFSAIPGFTLDAAANDAAGGGSGNDAVTIFDPGLIASGLAHFSLLTGGGASNTLTVNGGSFDLDTNAADNPNLTVNVNTDGAGAADVVLNATQHLAALNIGSGGRFTLAAANQILVTKALSVAIGGKLDLNRSAMIFDYTGASVLSTVQNFIISGYSNGAWTGSGIISSAAPANPGTTLGFGEASQLFGAFPASFLGEAVDSTSVLVRFTLLGDANLDQKVDFSDLVAIAQNFGGSGKTYPQGDFNYDSRVDFIDLVAVAQKYGTALPAPVPVVPISPIASPAASPFPAASTDARAAKVRPLRAIARPLPVKKATGSRVIPTPASHSMPSATHSFS